jgi:glyoxylase-like metal-dependent hydrolase (beta-lactamase superfamily II)
MTESVRTSGIFSLDGVDFEVENNIWLVGNDSEVLIVDAAHDATPIVDAVAGRRVVAIVATHGHNDHINAAATLSDAVGAPIWLHPADLELWGQIHPSREPDAELADGQRLIVGEDVLEVRHTPGHSPGGCCLYEARSNRLFSGDTLFRGGPGATGRRFSDFPTIIESIRSRLLVLPPSTRVLTGHGAETTIGEEAPHLDEWIARGH